MSMPWALTLPTRPSPDEARATARGRERALRRILLGTPASNLDPWPNELLCQCAARWWLFGRIGMGKAA